MSNKSKVPDLIYPSVDSMIADSLDILQMEITKFKTKVVQGRSLDSREAKTLQGYLKSLVDLSREDRERASERDLADLSTEELLALLGKQQKSLTGKSGSDS